MFSLPSWECMVAVCFSSRSQQSRLVYTPVNNEMPIAYLTHPQRLPVSGSCNFNPRTPAACARRWPYKLTAIVPADELQIKRISEVNAMPMLSRSIFRSLTNWKEPLTRGLRL